MSLRQAPILIVSLLAVVSLAGCGAGDVVDDQKTGIAVRYDVEQATGEKVESVECPSDVPVSAGTTFDCLVTTESGEEALASIEVLNDDADLKVTGLSAP